MIWFEGYFCSLLEIPVNPGDELNWQTSQNMHYFKGQVWKALGRLSRSSDGEIPDREVWDFTSLCPSQKDSVILRAQLGTTKLELIWGTKSSLHGGSQLRWLQPNMQGLRSNASQSRAGCAGCNLYNSLKSVHFQRGIQEVTVAADLTSHREMRCRKSSCMPQLQRLEWAQLCAALSSIVWYCFPLLGICNVLEQRILEKQIWNAFILTISVIGEKLHSTES